VSDLNLNYMQIILLLLTLSYAAILNRTLLNTTKYPRAVCNDGSPAGYYFKNSTSSDWLIF
jgi:hypothetical protein